MSRWTDNLRPASWRGVDFVVLATEGQAGRRIHLHEYPFRDDPWAEDLGRRARTLSLKGFLVGDDVAFQLERMEQAAEQRGPGELIHPTRGNRSVTLMNFSYAEAWDQGRVVQIVFEFLETGERRFPESVTDSLTEVLGAADVCDLAVVEDYEVTFADRLAEGYAAAQNAARYAQAQATAAKRLADSATGAMRAVASIGGFNLGRFNGGSYLTGATTLTGAVSSALSRLSTARARVASTAAQAVDLAGRL